MTLAAYAEYADAVPADVFAQYRADLADVAARARTGLVLVAESDGDLAGSATFYPDASAAGMGWSDSCAAVRAVAVSPRFRSRGIARRLMAHCAQLARSTGASYLCLHTATFMTAAMALYTRLGYIRTPQDDVDVNVRYALEGRPPMTVIGYRLPLFAAQSAEFGVRS